MRRIVAFLTIISMLFVLAAGCSSNSSAKKSKFDALGADPKDIKVGFIYIGAHNDDGYSQAHDTGRKAIEKQLGVKTQYVENVPESSECEKVARDLIDQGCNVIVGTSFGHGEWLLKVAKDNPNIIFLHATGLTNSDNLGTMFARVYQPRYLSGIAAGLKTKSNKIGYVAAMPIPEVIRGINAFTLGVQSVNPKATVEVMWTNTWYDVTLERQAAITLADKGCDVIAQHCDSTAAQIAAQDKGVYSVGYNSSSPDAAPKAYLTAPLFHWDKIYLNEMNAIIDGTWKPGHYWGSMAEGCASLDTLTSLNDPRAAALIQTAQTKIMNGTWDVFTGPIYDQDGKLKVAKGKVMSDADMLAFGWFVKGVVGTIPKS